MESLCMFNADTYVCDNTNVKEELSEFPELIAHTKRKNPTFDNYFKAKDMIMKIMEKRPDIIAGTIKRNQYDCIVYFKKARMNETSRNCFIRLVDGIRKKDNIDLFIKIVA